MARQPAPQQSPNRAVNGVIHAVPCPHCGKHLDLRQLQEDQLLDTGSVIDCDYCKRLIEVARIQPVTIVTVRRALNRGGTTMIQQSRQPPARQATTLSPAAVRKLLKGR